MKDGCKGRATDRCARRSLSGLGLRSNDNASHPESLLWKTTANDMHAHVCNATENTTCPGEPHTRSHHVSDRCAMLDQAIRAREANPNNSAGRFRPAFARHRPPSICSRPTLVVTAPGRTHPQIDPTCIRSPRRIRLALLRPPGWPEGKEPTLPTEWWGAHARVLERGSSKSGARQSSSPPHPSSRGPTGCCSPRAFSTTTLHARCAFGGARLRRNLR